MLLGGRPGSLRGPLPRDYIRVLAKAFFDLPSVWYHARPFTLDDEGCGAGAEARRLPGVARLLEADEEAGGEYVARARRIDRPGWEGVDMTPRARVAHVGAVV